MWTVPHRKEIRLIEIFQRHTVQCLATAEYVEICSERSAITCGLWLIFGIVLEGKFWELCERICPDLGDVDTKRAVLRYEIIFSVVG